MISILRRTDNSTFRVSVDDSPWESADRLSQGHDVSVHVVAVLQVDADKLQQCLHIFHLGNLWYECSLKDIMAAWTKVYGEAAGCDMSELDGELDGEHLLEPQIESPRAEDDILPSCLEYAKALQAPLASELRHSLITKLGKQNAQAVLKRLKPKTHRRGDTTVRVHSFEGQAVTMRER